MVVKQLVRPCARSIYSSYYREKITGACHGDELGYLFYGQLLNFKPKADSDDYKMCRTMSKMWAKFAITECVNRSNY